jgi:hypothetical protein
MSAGACRTILLRLNPALPKSIVQVRSQAKRSHEKSQDILESPHSIFHQSANPGSTSHHIKHGCSLLNETPDDDNRTNEPSS